MPRRRHRVIKAVGLREMRGAKTGIVKGKAHPPPLYPGWKPGDKWGPGENDVVPGGPPAPKASPPRGRGNGKAPVGHTSTGRTTPTGNTLGQGRSLRGVPTRTGPSAPAMKSSAMKGRTGPAAGRGPIPPSSTKSVASRGRTGGTGGPRPAPSSGGATGGLANLGYGESVVHAEPRRRRGVSTGGG